EAAAVVLRHASIGRRADECAACPAGGLSWLTLQLTAGAQRDLNESDCQFNRRSGCNSSASPLYARPFHTRALVSGREKSGGDRRWRKGFPSVVARGGQPERKSNGSARFHHASAPGSWRSFRPPDAPLESEDGALHLWRPQQYPYHRPVA